MALHFIFQATSNQIEELPKKRKYTKKEKEKLPKKKRKSEKEKPSTSKVSVTVKPKTSQKEVKKQPKKVPKGNCQFKYLFKCEFKTSSQISFSARQSKAREEEK